MLGPALPVVLTALLVAVLITGTVWLLALHTYAPSVQVPGWFTPGSERTLDGLTVVALVSLAVGLGVGIWLFLYRPNRDRVHEYWASVSLWARATVTGFAGAVVVTIAVAAVSPAWPPDARVVATGFALSWPIVAGLTILYERQADAAPTLPASLKIGYVHAKGLESRTMAVVVGVLAAVVTALATWSLTARFLEEPSEAAAVAVALVALTAVTVIAYRRYEVESARKTELVITDVVQSDPEAAPILQIRNEASAPIDLTYAKIRDTELDLYRFDVDVTLGPGELCTFEPPASFRLSPNDDSRELPLGYTLKRGSEMPAILTETGELYSLHKTAEASELPVVEAEA